MPFCAIACLLPGCDHYDTVGSINCANNNGDLSCIIDIYVNYFPDPSWTCDGTYGGGAVSAEDKEKMCEFAVPLFEEKCDGGGAEFRFNRKDIQGLGKGEEPTKGKEFDFKCD